jgi:Pyruvate/2-oxoacid:ferredoxin oxidoreductase delta subunit
MFGTSLLIVVGLILALMLAIWIVGERGGLLRRSTRAWLAEGGWRHFRRGDFLHAYVYSRWTNQYIGRAVRFVFPKLKPVEGERRWADEYHGKVLPIDLARKLVSVEQDIPRQDLEQIIPYSTARDLVLKAPLEIVAYECGCRHSRPNPCQPTQVCMVVGQPFADFILEHNPQSSRRITQSEAIQILEEEHARGHLHAAYFKDVMLNRFYAVCNCCKCCCGGIEAMRDHGVPMVTSSGYVAQIDDSHCQACGKCQDACPFGAIQVDGVSRVTWELCMGCGVCEGRCPNQAVSLVRDERKGIPLDISMLTH